MKRWLVPIVIPTYLPRFVFSNAQWCLQGLRYGENGHCGEFSQLPAWDSTKRHLISYDIPHKIQKKCCLAPWLQHFSETSWAFTHPSGCCFFQKETAGRKGISLSDLRGWGSLGHTAFGCSAKTETALQTFQALLVPMSMCLLAGTWREHDLVSL